MNIMIVTFICKIMDNALSTLKNIYLHKGKYLASSMFSAAGTFFYMVAIVNAVKDNSLNSIISMCVATFLGSYLPAKLVEKMEKDELYVYEVTTDSFKNGIEFADKIKELNMPVKTMTAYNANTEKVINCKVFCSNKAESTLIKELIAENDKFKYHAYAAKDC